jgi:hypothetical protein
MITNFAEEVQRLHSAHPKPPIEQRIAEVDRLIEDYVKETGKRPDGRHLNRLSDYLLVDDLTDQHKHLRNHEAPFHSQKQVERRQKRQVEYDDGYRKSARG